MTGNSRILVVYATCVGSTAEIAEFIGNRLRDAGCEVDVRSVAENPHPRDYRAIVIGSAVRFQSWLPAAEDYAVRHADELAYRPVWMFSVGLVPSLQGPIGSRLGAVVPARIATLQDLIMPSGYRAFAGVFERGDKVLTTRVVYYAIGGRRYGDLRDWSAIAAWASCIAAQLHTTDSPEGHDASAPVVSADA